MFELCYILLIEYLHLDMHIITSQNIFAFTPLGYLDK